MADRDLAPRFPHTSGDALATTSYFFVRSLGRGTSGTVVEAEHRVLRSRVVIKILRADYAASGGMADRFRLEAQAAASLGHHPNIATVSDFGQLPDGRLYIVMPRFQGRTLREEIAERGPVPIDEAIGLARQVLAGLAEAHALGIIHRDIKPENLFLCDAVRGGERVLKILDFGIAKVADNADAARAPAPLTRPTEEGIALGTPRFLSPEQALGQRVDGRADLYAVAGLLYWLVTGLDPFHHRSGALALLRAQAGEIPAPPSAWARQPIPAALDWAILKGLEKSPSARHATSEAFSEELARILGETPRAARWDRTEPIDISDLAAARAHKSPPTAPLAAFPRDSGAATLPLLPDIARASTPDDRGARGAAQSTRSIFDDPVEDRTRIGSTARTRAPGAAVVVIAAVTLVILLLIALLSSMSPPIR